LQPIFFILLFRSVDAKQTALLRKYAFSPLTQKKGLPKHRKPLRNTLKTLPL